MLVAKEGKERIGKGREENTWKKEIIGQWSRKRKLRERGWGDWRRKIQIFGVEEKWKLKSKTMVVAFSHQPRSAPATVCT